MEAVVIKDNVNVGYKDLWLSGAEHERSWRSWVGAASLLIAFLVATIGGFTLSYLLASLVIVGVGWACLVSETTHYTVPPTHAWGRHIAWWVVTPDGGAVPATPGARYRRDEVFTLQQPAHDFRLCHVGRWVGNQPFDVEMHHFRVVFPHGQTAEAVTAFLRWYRSCYDLRGDATWTDSFSSRLERGVAEVNAGNELFQLRLLKPSSIAAS